MPDLHDLPTNTFTLEFALPPESGEIFETFGIDDPSDWREDAFDQLDYPDAAYLASSHILLDIDEEGGVFYDQNGKEIPEEAMDDLVRASADATLLGTEAKVYEAAVGAVTDALETFSDYSYEYHAAGDDGYELFQGVANGVIDVSAHQGVLTVTLATDIVHVIMDIMGGVGEFEPWVEFEDLNAQDSGDAVKDFVEGHFHLLRDYWEVYGDVQPTPSDVDWAFWKEGFVQDVEEVESHYGINVLDSRAHGIGEKFRRTTPDPSRETDLDYN